MKRLLFIILFPLLAVILLTACNNNIYSSRDLEVIKEERFPVSQGKELKVKVDGGDVIVTSWDKSEVYIKVLGNENAREKLDFNFENNDSYVQLNVESKESFFNWFSNISLRIEIKVPGKFNTNIHTSGGDIKLARVEGNHQLKTSGGDVISEDFTGTMDASTSGGDISLKGSNSSINANTSGGDIKLDYSGENMGIDLSTSGGDILVKLPESFDAAMELSTSGGDVSCDLSLNNTTKLSDSKIIADLNNGGEEFVAHTSGGDIDVRKK